MMLVEPPGMVPLRALRPMNTPKGYCWPRLIRQGLRPMIVQWRFCQLRAHYNRARPLRMGPLHGLWPKVHGGTRLTRQGLWPTMVVVAVPLRMGPRPGLWPTVYRWPRLIRQGLWPMIVQWRLRQLRAHSIRARSRTQNNHSRRKLGFR